MVVSRKPSQRAGSVKPGPDPAAGAAPRPATALAIVQTASARPALAARAVLAALEFLRERGAAFYLEGIDFLQGFHAPVALALVQALSGRAKRSLTGCALVGDSREEAAARATLSAINRFYGSLPHLAGR